MFEIINATSNVYNLTCGHLMRLYIRAILKNLFLRYDIDYIKKNFVLKTYINSECEGYANPRTISDMYRYYGLLWTISINEHGGLVFAKKPVEPTTLRILVDLIQHSIVILAQDGWTISGLEYNMDILPPCVVELFKLHKKKLIGDKISMQTVYDCIFTNSPINAELKKVYDGRKIVKNLKKEWETNFSSTKLTPHISKVAELFPDYMPPQEVVVNVSAASTSSNSGTIKVKRLKRVGFGVRFGDNDAKKVNMEILKQFFFYYISRSRLVWNKE